MNKLLPSSRYVWENELIMAGLDPQDISNDITTPIGIGNYVAESIINARMDDGMNQEGNDKVYHKARYSSLFKYEPKNSPYEIKYPDNWQPLINEVDFGVYASQVHVVPQYGSEIPYSLRNVDSYMAPIPVKSKISNMNGYVEQTQQILTESYTLNDRKKMLAEYFDDKTWSLDGTTESIISQNTLDLDEYIFLQMAVKIGLHDAGIVAWKEKMHYDCVRPTTAIRYLYGNNTIKAWGGPGQGAVDDMKGNEWRSYIPTGPHSEYPSGTTCFCSAQAQVLRRYFNSEMMNHSVKFIKGSSVIEPWRTPTADLTVEFTTYDEYVQTCGLSRVYAGVHFLASAKEAEKLCKGVGDVAYEFVYAQVNGDFDTSVINWNINNEDKFKTSLKFL